MENILWWAIGVVIGVLCVRLYDYIKYKRSKCQNYIALESKAWVVKWEVIKWRKVRLSTWWRWEKKTRTYVRFIWQNGIVYNVRSKYFKPTK